MRATTKPTPTAASSATFPSGAYGKYKRATAYFLHWLLRARQLGGFGVLENANNREKPTKKNKKHKNSTISTANTLDQYERIVANIAEAPTTLPASLRRQWPRALAACESAITLRAQVAQFFSPKTDDDSHLHFLERLTKWFHQLRDANVGHTLPTLPTSVSAEKTLDFANYYDVLDLPDDFFDDTADEIEFQTTASTSSTSSPARALSARERRRLAEAPFADDAALEVAYFLLELDELSESVYSAYFQVKIQQKTLVEATVVALVAIDFAKRAIARFQLQHPTIRDANDLKTMLYQYASIESIHAIADTVDEKWTPSVGTEPTHQYVRGAALLDFLWITSCLETVDDIFPDKHHPRQVLGLPEGGFGAIYNEERTQDYTIPGFDPLPCFFLQQLRLLYNATIDNRARGVELDQLGFTDVFFRPLMAFFKTRVISIELVVVCMYWVRSVSALQGDAGLSRTVSLSLQHQWKLQAQLRASVEKPRTDPRDAPFLEPQDDMAHDMAFTDELTGLTRANPLLAGGFLLSHHLNYLHVGIEVSSTTTQLRAFAYIYSALRDRQLLPEIPFFEYLVTLFGIFFFTPSRAVATMRGDFLRDYRAKQSEFASTSARGKHRHKHHSELCRCLQSLSTTVRIIDHYDYYKELSAELLTPTTSWKARLDRISELCSIDLFGARCLSLDMLAISNDFADLFLALHDELGVDSEFAALLAVIDPPQRNAAHQNQTLEDVVAARLLPMVELLNTDGSVSLAVARATFGSADLSDRVLQYCQRAAAIISERFDPSDPARMERTYFTFPSKPEWFDLEFGGPMDVASVPTESTKSTFRTLMTMMEESTGPLNDEQLVTLKNHVKTDPALLSMVVPGPDVELCTLFHHAAAGRARDRSLTEWLIQMGALHRQPKHFYNPGQRHMNTSVQNRDLCNYMAVHSAAKAGLTDMVRLILEADLLHDTNKVTYHTKESLVHLAVRNGDRPMYYMLEELSANLCHKDAAGRYVYDVAKNPKWKREILEMTVRQRESEMEVAAHKKAAAEEEEAEKRAKETPTKTTIPGPVAATKKKTKARTASQTAAGASADDAVLTEAVQRMDELRMSKTVSSKAPSNRSEEPPVDRIAQLTHWLDTLKDSGVDAADESDCDAAATAAVHLLDTLRASVQYFALAPTLELFSIGVVQRDAVDASRALFLLSKFYRQLPSATRDLATSQDASALEKLRLRTGPAHSFGEFQAFAFHAACLLRSCGRRSQANELLALVERRLLKQKTSCGDATFQQNVTAYVAERKLLRFEPADGSSLEAQRVFADV